MAPLPLELLVVGILLVVPLVALVWLQGVPLVVALWFEDGSTCW